MANDISLTGLTEILFKARDQVVCEPIGFSQGVMVNAGGNVPIDESPNCYKPAKDVISAVVKSGLARVAYTLTPIVSLKGVD